MRVTRVVLLLAVTVPTHAVLAQPGSLVSVINTPSVTVSNTPEVTVTNVPGVTVLNAPSVVVDNDIGSAVPVEVIESVDNDPQALVEYRIIGYTNVVSPGRIEADGGLGGLLVGYAAMHALCAEQFGSGTRAAFTGEAILPTPLLFGQNPRLAWVIPSFLVPWYGDPDAIADATCGWHEQTTPATGLAVAPFIGRLTNTSCENELPVACSAPVAISIQSSQ